MREFNNNKYCPRCQCIYYPADVAFGIQGDKVDGLRCYCRLCRSERWQSNKEENTKRGKIYYEENKEDILKNHKVYYENHKEEIKEYRKNYYDENREYLIEQSTIWNKKNKNKRRKRSKKYRKQEKYKIQQKRYRDKKYREMGFIPLFDNPFPDDIHIDYHHINNLLIIPMPTHLHKKAQHPNREEHRERANFWLYYIYGVDFDLLLRGD